MSDLYSVVIIAPVAILDIANRSAVAFGWDAAPLPGASLNMPLSDDGSTLTHMGCRAQASESFLAMMAGAAQGNLPEGLVWADFGLTEDDPVTVAQGVILDARPMSEIGDGPLADHFAEVCAGAGLVAYVPTEVPGDSEEEFG